MVLFDKLLIVRHHKVLKIEMIKNNQKRKEFCFSPSNKPKRRAA
jgi:hypothetical protein